MQQAVLFALLLSFTGASLEYADVAMQGTSDTKVAADFRTVQVEIREGNRLVAQPTLKVQLGAPAAITVSGDQGYKLTVTVEQGQPGSPYLVKSHYHKPHAGSWKLVASPSLTVGEGQQAKLSLSRRTDLSFSVRVQ